MSMKYQELCDAMKEASITDPESQRGIDFCIEKCPFDHCVVMEPVTSQVSIKRIENIRRAKEMHRKKMTVKAIAKELGVSIGTVFIYLKK